MKKIFLNFLAVILVFSLFGCGNITGENERDTLNDSSTDPQTEIEIEYWGPNPKSPPIHEYKLNSLEEYQAFVSERNLPTKFVRYEDISYLGDFTSLSIFSWEENGPFLPGSNSEISNINYMYEFNNGEFYITFGYNNAYGDFRRISPILQQSFELSNDVMNEKKDFTFVDKDFFENEWSKRSDNNWITLGSYDFDYNPNAHVVYNRAQLYAIVICTDEWDSGLETYTDVEVDITFEPYVLSEVNTYGNGLVLAHEKTVEDYDFSSEELNKFFYKETVLSAFNTLGEHITRTAS